MYIYICIYMNTYIYIYIYIYVYIPFGVRMYSPSFPQTIFQSTFLNCAPSQVEYPSTHGIFVGRASFTPVHAPASPHPTR